MAARVFVSYSHRDEAVATALAGHLDQLTTLGLAEVWLDRQLELGAAWETRIVDQIKRSDAFLLLVSPGFLTSEFIRERELPLIESVGRAGAPVIPVVVASCLWARHPYIGSLQAFNQGRPLESPTTRTFGRQAAQLVEQLVGLLDFTRSNPRGAPEKAPAEPATAGAREVKARGRGATGRTRVDPSGMARKGSQLQTQIYVNARTQELNEAVRASLRTLPAEAELEWRSPLAAAGFREYHDRAFLRALGLEQLTADLQSFWPKGGPRWDALARVASGDRDDTGVVLVEAKSYPTELSSGGSKAVDVSRERIVAAMTEAQEELSVTPDPERWMGRFYQFANRLAHLVWLRRMGVDAWLLHLLFTNDPHGPTSEAEWRGAIEEMHAELRLDEPVLDHVGVAVLPASSPSERPTALA